MQLLKTGNFSKNGLWYTQLKRTFGDNRVEKDELPPINGKALYGVSQHKYSKNYVGYEVMVIHVAPEKDVFGKHYPEREKFPANEDFGYTAWSWSTYDAAQLDYYALHV